jgi:proline dehydrogenase
MARFLFPLLRLIPRPLVRRVAARYIAGETIDDVLRVAASVHAAGFLTTVDVLGENVRSQEEARASTEEYLRLVDALAARRLPSQVSVKPTLVGLRLGEDLAWECLDRMARRGAERGISLTVDMEDSTTTDATLRIYRRLRDRHEHVGVAIQAYLERSLADVESLLPLRPRVRVCKGIYVEPPGVTIAGRQAVRESYARLVTALLEGGGYPEIATHDPWLVDGSLHALASRGMGPRSHEFQMLLGVGAALRPRIRAAGSALRLYCPYGRHWHPYSLRRLKENPRMLRYVLQSALSPRNIRIGGGWGESFR